MLIAIDYDGTYTADPDLWAAFIASCEARGHEVICVTCRRSTPENRREVIVPSIPKYDHYFTGLSSKRWFLEQMGIKPDIWIDDMPETVKEGR